MVAIASIAIEHVGGGEDAKEEEDDESDGSHREAVVVVESGGFKGDEILIKSLVREERKLKI